MTNTKSSSHSAWLTFMFPRLYLARQLLNENGVMFISIDDNELANLKLLCDNIFGEENIESMIWHKVDNDSGKLKITHRFRNEHEYILCVYKNKELVDLFIIYVIYNFWYNTSKENFFCFVPFCNLCIALYSDFCIFLDKI